VRGGGRGRDEVGERAGEQVWVFCCWPFLFPFLTLSVVSGSELMGPLSSKSTQTNSY
jgi:hypothetical protein